VNKSATTGRDVMSETEMDKNGATGEGERTSRRRAPKAGAPQDVLKLIDVARAAGVKEIVKLRALAKECAERADAIERKLGSMLDVDSLSRPATTEMEAALTTGAAPTERERPAVAESATAPRPTARSARLKRSVEELSKAVDRIVDLLSGQARGMRADQICEALGLRAKDLARMLQEGLDTNRIQSKGEKRSTVYFASR